MKIEVSSEVDILAACRAQFPGRPFSELSDQEIGHAIACALDQMGSPSNIDEAQVGRECREASTRVPLPCDYTCHCSPKGEA